MENTEVEQGESQVLKESMNQLVTAQVGDKIDIQQQDKVSSNLLEEHYSILLGKKDLYLAKRVECQGFYGTIKYSGPLTHEGRPANSEYQLWFGVEWDDETRGRHNGTVKSTEYFSTKNNKNSGTLVKYEKVNLGIDILDGVLAKYFKESIPANLKQQIQDQVDKKHQKQILKDQSENMSDSQQQQLNAIESQEKEEEKKSGEDAKKKLIQVELDEDAYFETFKKHKKMVQFYGFDKIWDRLNNITELTEISLQEVCISDLGAENYLRRLLPNMKILSLEKNLLFDWDQVFQIGYELPQLESLQITSNHIKHLEQSVSSRQSKDNEHNLLMCWSTFSRIKNVTPIGVFHNLRTLIVIDCNLNWTQVSLFLPAFPTLEELFLCRNDMTDFQNFTYRDEDLKNLTFLNLENTNLTDIEGLKVHLAKLKSIKRLTLNKNKLKQLGELSVYENIVQISMENNLIEDPIIFTELSKFTNLIYLNLKHNPIGDKYGRSYVRQRAVAEIPKLEYINGSNLKKYERKDCEIYYLRRTFDDYFNLTGQVYYKYNLDQFLDWTAKEHPNHCKLLSKYGNPYEQQPEENKIITEDSTPKNVMISLTLVAAAGPQLGKVDKVKKFPYNTTILSLKNVLSKLYGIPNDKLVLKYRVNQHDPNEILDEDHKTIQFYGIKDNSMLIVDQQD